MSIYLQPAASWLWLHLYFRNCFGKVIDLRMCVCLATWQYLVFLNITVDQTILLTLKSSSTKVPYSFKEETATIINDLILPAPPTQAVMTEDSVQQLIIPNPDCE